LNTLEIIGCTDFDAIRALQTHHRHPSVCIRISSDFIVCPKQSNTMYRVWIGQTIWDKNKAESMQPWSYSQQNNNKKLSYRRERARQLLMSI